MSEPWKQVLLVESLVDGEWYPWEMAGERRDTWDRYDDNPTFRIRRFVPEDALAAERARAERAELRAADLGRSRQDWIDLAERRLSAFEHEERECKAAEGREARLRECVKDALDCLPRALDGSSPFSLSQRAEVMLAIDSLNRALAGTTDPNERAAQLIQAMPRDCAGCGRCQPDSHPKPPGLKTRQAAIRVTEVTRDEPTILPDEINEGDGTPEGEPSRAALAGEGQG